MSYPSSFCLNKSQFPNGNWYKTLSGILSSKNLSGILSSLADKNQLTTFNQSLGVDGNLTPSISQFYEFWSSSVNSNNIATIVNNFFNTGQCANMKEYNRWLLIIFFCNTFPQGSVYPKLTVSNINYNTQSRNLHQYFLSQGGGGLGYCGDPTSIPILESFCKAITPEGQNVSVFVSSSPSIYQWCGCYSGQTPLAETTAQRENDQQRLACNPMCSYTESIKLYRNNSDTGLGDNYQELDCTETLCVIDDVSIKVIDSEGKITFNQICPGCDTSGNCTCIIDTSVQGILDKIVVGDGGSQDPVSFNQVCPGAQCYSVNSQGIYTKIKCNTNNNANTGKDPFFGYNGDGFLRDLDKEANLDDGDYAGFIAIAIILLVFIFIAFSGLGEVKRIFRKEGMPKMTYSLKGESLSKEADKNIEKPKNNRRYAPR